MPCSPARSRGRWGDRLWDRHDPIVPREASPVSGGFRGHFPDNSISGKPPGSGKVEFSPDWFSRLDYPCPGTGGAHRTQSALSSQRGRTAFPAATQIEGSLPASLSIQPISLLHECTFMCRIAGICT